MVFGTVIIWHERVLLVIAAALFSLLIVPRRDARYLGLRLFALPLGFGALALLPALVMPGIQMEAERVLRPLMAFSWVLFARGQYRLNKVSIPFRLSCPLGYSLFGGSLLAAVCSFLPYEFASLALKLSSVGSALLLLCAAAAALSMVPYHKRLPASTRGGMLMAAIGIVYYPFIALADVFGFRPSPFDPDRLMALQCYPFWYTIFVMVIAATLLFCRWGRKPWEVPDKPALTKREEEVLNHLARGLSSREIADTCHVSLATVKTHSRNLCRKYAVPGLRALRTRLGQGESK